MSRGLWDYAQADHVARDSVECFSYDCDFEFDDAVLNEHIAPPGLVVDLGCGRGRSLLPLARRGLRCVGIDLSLAMLRIVGEQSRDHAIRIDQVQANLSELDCLRDAIADYAIMMFSTLGMISGREARRAALRHARRILRPGGLFICHAHNRWLNARDPQGRRWLWKNLWESLVRGEREAGDKVFQYHEIPNVLVHVFTRGEFKRALLEAGFRIERLIPLDVPRRGPLSHAWLLGGLRASGWIAICRAD